MSRGRQRNDLDLANDTGRAGIARSAAQQMAVDRVWSL